jgi:predicted metal-dependent hydrolase
MQLSLIFEADSPVPVPAAPGAQALSSLAPSLLSPSRLAPSSDLPVPVFAFVRHPRARRYLIRVTGEGTVRVTIPRGGSKREAAAFADRERAWIDKQLRARAQREQRDRERRTRIGLGASNGERHEADRREAIASARRELPRRLLELAAQHGLTVSRISIRNQRWRWGSCSRNGHICLNWRLVTVPDEVRDYVLIHELMHLKRMDHSPKFWQLVSAACPAYKDARRWLRQRAAREMESVAE